MLQRQNAHSIGFMKKLFIIIAIICALAASAGRMLHVEDSARAASEYESAGNVASGVIGTLGTGVTYELSPGKMFSFDSNFGQDLYKITYNRVAHQGSDLTVERVVARSGGKVSKEDLIAALPGTNIGKLLAEPDPTKGLTPDDIKARRVEMQQMVADEKEIADMEVLSKMDVEPTEFFSNGDESDSGFDLIADLEIIDAILFADMETQFGSAGAGDKPGSKVVNLGAGAGAEEEEEQAARARAEQADRQARADAEARRRGEGAGAGVAAGEEGGPASALCPLNQSFNSAVNEARAREEASARGGAGAGRGGQGAGAGGAAGGDSAGTGAGGAGAGGEAGADTNQPVQPEEPADWKLPSLCGERFCLKIEKKYKTDSSYQVTDNCIACHFEKINDAFKKTIGHNLVPSKLTGNLMELPKCKRSMFNLKQNFILVPTPIITPPNDDLVTRGNFGLQLLSLYDGYYSNPGRCDAAKKKAAAGEELKGELCKPDPDIRAEAGARALGQAGEQKTPTEIITEINQEVAARKTEAAETMEQARVTSEAETEAAQYQVLMQEMDTMNAYFKGFTSLYNQLISGKEDSPCKVLKDKEACK